MGPTVTEATSSETEKLNTPTRLEKRTEAAFAEEERQGLMLAAKVRTIALMVIVFWQAVSNLGQFFENPDFRLEYFIGLAEIAFFALLGVLQYFCAKHRFQVDVLKYVFVFVDCVFLAFMFSVEYSFQEIRMPPALQVEGSRFAYFFIILMQAAFSFRPRLVLWCGVCIAAARTGMWLWFMSRPGVYTNVDLPEQTLEALLTARDDSNFLYLGFLATEVVAALIVAAGLAVVVRRSRILVESRSIAERTRANLARYFSPNVVDHLSSSENPFGEVREQEVAVLFADIIGFTKLCETETPDDVVALLREYHTRLGHAVFENEGTLDKYIGDCIMATFGTPEPSPHDARNALQCAMDMITALEDWNAERVATGAAPVHTGIGLHYGPVIAGDMGNERRLEYSVIGDTVNIASRLEHLTRSMDTPLVVSDSLVAAIARNGDNDKSPVRNLTDGGVQKIRGRETGVPVWIMSEETN